jgi:hypothetical protein
MLEWIHMDLQITKKISWITITDVRLRRRIEQLVFCGDRVDLRR